LTDLIQVRVCYLIQLHFIYITDSGDIIVPPILALDNNSITSAGPSIEISSMCSKVKELDLTNNKIVDWEQVSMVIT